MRQFHANIVVYEYTIMNRRELQINDKSLYPKHFLNGTGVAAMTAMTHIAIMEQADGKSADWMEHVSDEQYRPRFEGSNKENNYEQSLVYHGRR